MWWDWKGVLYYELLPENRMINSNKYCSQLDQLKAVLYKKHLESVNRERIISYQDNARPHISLMTTQKLFSSAGKFWFIHCIHQTLHLPMPFWSSQNSLNGKNFNSLKNYKRHLEQFLCSKRYKIWGRWNY